MTYAAGAPSTDLRAPRITREGLRHYFPAVLLTILGVILCARLWGRVGDLPVDFGRELYVAQQIVQGHALYRDMAYMYGPLSPYVNAGWWTLLGGGERAIIVGNLLILIAGCALMYRLFVLAADRWAATVAMALFLACGVFCANTRITNYNFLTPYAHGTTHGLALCLGAITSILALHRTRCARYAALAGALVGLTFLTKPEIFFAGTLATGGGLVVSLLREQKRSNRLACGGTFVGAMLIPPALALALLSSAMPFDIAREGWLNSWLHLRAATASPYFVADMGRDRLGFNTWKVIRYACLYGKFLIPLFLAAIVLRRWLYARPRLALALSLLIAAGVFALTQRYPYRPRFWLDAGRGLPVFPLVGVIVGLVAVHRPRDATSRGLAILMFSLLAGGLILKLGMNARLYNYGFVLATPAIALGALIATGWLPDLARRVGGYAPLIRLGATAPALGLIVWQQSATNRILAERTIAVDTPSGLLRLSPKQSTYAQAITALKRVASPGQTLAVFPDGAGVNFAAGMFNPAVYDILNPLVIALHGESRILCTYQAHPPDFILLCQVNLAPYGAERFGEDFAKELFAFLRGNYERIETFGTPGDGRIPLELYRRRRGPMLVNPRASP